MTSVLTAIRTLILNIAPVSTLLILPTATLQVAIPPVYRHPFYSVTKQRSLRLCVTAILLPPHSSEHLQPALPEHTKPGMPFAISNSFVIRSRITAIRPSGKGITCAANETRLPTPWHERFGAVLVEPKSGRINR